MSIYGDRAYAAFFKGYNCCQSVAVAFAEEMGMTEKQALQISAGFGGGFGRMRRSAVCSPVSHWCWGHSTAATTRRKRPLSTPTYKPWPPSTRPATAGEA